MKTLPLILLASIGLLTASVVLAGCDRSMDDINPEPIADNQYNPATAYPSMMATGKSAIPTEAGTDTVTEPGDTTPGGDGVAADTEQDVNECIGSATYCACIASKGNDEEKYSEYCNCMDSPSVPGGSNATYCGCCVFAYDSSFPEYTEEWQFLVTGTCDPQGYTPPCQFD